MSTVRRALRFVVGSLSIALVFVLALAGGALLHLDLPPVRRIAVGAVNQILATTFRGTVHLSSVQRLGLGGIEGLRGTIVDPDGKTILQIESASAEISLEALLRSQWGRHPLAIVVPSLEVDYAEVVLRSDEKDHLTWTTSFDALTPSVPTSDPGPGVRVEIRRAYARHVWLHGALAGAPPVDADVDDLRGSVDVASHETMITLNQAQLTVRGLLPDEVRATLKAQLAIPDDKPLRTQATVDAHWRALRISVETRLEDNHVTARGDVALGDGSIGIDASADLEPEVRARASLAIRGINAHLLVPSAPDFPVTGTVIATVNARSGEDPQGEFQIHTDPTELAHQPLPAADAKGSFAGSTVQAHIDVHEPGAPIALSVTLKPEMAPRVGFGVDFDARVSSDDLSQVSRLNRVASGSLRVATKGHVAFDGPSADIALDAAAGGLTVGDIQIHRATMRARASGTIDALAFDVQFNGDELQWQHRVVPSLEIHADGTPCKFAVEVSAAGGGDLPKVHAVSQVALGGGVVLTESQIGLTRRSVVMAAKIPHVYIGEGVVDVEHVDVEGLGDPMTLSFGLRGSNIRVKVGAPRINLEKVAELFPIQNAVTGGNVALDAEWAGTMKGRGRGHLNARVDRAAVTGMGALGLTLFSSIEDERVSLDARLESDPAGWLELKAPQLQLRGAAFDANAWLHAVGVADMTAHIDLASLRRVMPSLPRDAAGIVKARVAVVGRDRNDIMPDIRISVETEGLYLDPRIAGIDARVLATLDGQTGEFGASALTWDAEGVWFGVDAKAYFPWAALVADSDRRRRVLANAPYAIRGYVPRRSLREFAALAGATLGNESLEVESDITYDGQSAFARIGGYDAGGEVLKTTVTGTMRAMDFLETASVPRWTASVHTSLDAFPVESVGVVGGPPLRGKISGNLELLNLGQDASLEARFDGDNLYILDQSILKSQASISLKSGMLVTDMAITQKQGNASIHAEGKMEWGSSLVPRFVDDSSVDLAYAFSNFRLRPLTPLIRGKIKKIDGYLDGKGVAHLRATGSNSTVEGGLALREGELQSPAFGGFWNHINGKLTADPTGRIVLNDVSASGLTGRITATGGAKLDGIALRNAQLFVRVDRKDAVPVSIDGEAIGQLWGRIDVQADVGGAGGMIVRIGVPSMHLELPKEASRDLQSLDDDSAITIGGITLHGDYVPIILKRPKEKRPVDTNPTPVHVSVNLGDDILITRGSMLSAQLDGNPRIDINDETVVSGQIRIRGGYVEVQGRRFILEDGTLSFVGDDSTNPTLVATASWTAPDADKTRVFVDFKGPVKTGVPELRSEPALPKSDILNLLLFGTTQGMEAGAAGGAVGGLIFGNGIGDALSAVTKVKVSASVATNEDSNPRPELKVQITPEISAQVGYNIVTPAPGQNPDRTVYAVDWRFLRYWSLAASGGDAGTTLLDLLWNYRY